MRNWSARPAKSSDFPAGLRSTTGSSPDEALIFEHRSIVEDRERSSELPHSSVSNRPLRVKNSHFRFCVACPLYPHIQEFGGHSGLGHKQTSAIELAWNLSVGGHLTR